ncbi:thiopeptide-type bacteriocin biosynthesis protein [Cellulophaga lytica]|nr:thiopeptide-type bacteriocin biosynthesis protein [Cellulophaga lytica]
MKRDFYIGEEWMYYKLYCGKNTANEILLHIFDNVIKELLKKGKIDKWFFIRYSDPNFHIRLRFHIVNLAFYKDVIDLVKDKLYPFLLDNIIWKFQTEGYSREIERYGGATIELVESLFYNDSTMIVNGIKEIQNEKNYLLFIIKSIDSTLESFGFDNNQKLSFCNNSLNQFMREFQLGTEQKKKLNAKYKNIEDELNEILSKNKENVKALEFEKNIKKRASKSQILIDEIKSQSKETKMENNIILGLIHMSVNRAFKDSQRFIEMIVYDYLFKYYSYVKHRN